MDVVLQARGLVNTAEIDLARWNLEMSMDEMHQAVRQIAGKVRTVVGASVFSEPPGYVHSRILLAGQLDVGIRLVVAQQDVEARLILLDQVVFERQRLFVVIDLDKVDIAGFADQRARFSRRPVGLR